MSGIIYTINKRLSLIGVLGFVLSLLLIYIPNQIDILTIIGGTENYVNDAWSKEYALVIAITINVLENFFKCIVDL